MFIYQFVHASRPHIDYSSMPIIRRCDLPTEPRENRYLEAILTAWHEQGIDKGIVILEQDIAIDPRHIVELEGMIADDPGSVHAVPYLCWPCSTGHAKPIWAHSASTSIGGRQLRSPPSACAKLCRYFALGCTYLPAKLIGNAPANDCVWDYPVLDARFSDLAWELEIGCDTTETPAVHLHW